MTIKIHVLSLQRAKKLSDSLKEGSAIARTEHADWFVFNSNHQTFGKAANKLQGLLLWYGLYYLSDYTIS